MWTCITLFRTVDDTVYRMEFEIDNEIRGGIDRLLFQNVKPFDLTLGKLARQGSFVRSTCAARGMSRKKEKRES